MAERRLHPRTPTSKAAELQFRSQSEVHDCIVIDESEGGIQVHLDENIGLPEALIIRYSDGVSRQVRRCWSSGNSAGLQFIEPAPQLSRPPEASLAAAVAAIKAATTETWQAVGIVKLIEFAIEDFHAAGRIEDARFLSEIKTNISTRFHLDGMATTSGGKLYH